MDDREHHLTRLRGLLNEASELIDRLAGGASSPEDERRVLGVTAVTLAKSQPRTKADVVRFAEAVQGGDEGWVVCRSIPGEHRIEAVYLAKLPLDVRRALDI